MHWICNLPEFEEWRVGQYVESQLGLGTGWLERITVYKTTYGSSNKIIYGVVSGDSGDSFMHPIGRMTVLEDGE